MKNQIRVMQNVLFCYYCLSYQSERTRDTYRVDLSHQELDQNLNYFKRNFLSLLSYYRVILLFYYRDFKSAYGVDLCSAFDQLYILF